MKTYFCANGVFENNAFNKCKTCGKAYLSSINKAIFQVRCDCRYARFKYENFEKAAQQWNKKQEALKILGKNHSK